MSSSPERSFSLSVSMSAFRSSEMPEFSFSVTSDGSSSSETMSGDSYVSSLATFSSPVFEQPFSETIIPMAMIDVAAKIPTLFFTRIPPRTSTIQGSLTKRSYGSSLERSLGKRVTSRTFSSPSSCITSLSIPIPSPP